MSGAGREVVIVDAGVGNLGNVRRAFEAVGARALVTAEPALIARAHRLVLPGVGAFRPPRERLRGALEGALATALEGGAHLLGICVGCQLLFEGSEEHGETDGLGLLTGRVTRLPASVELPQIGWNRLRRLAPHPLLAGLSEGTFAYFVHSYAPAEVPAEQILAQTVHGRAFPAIAARGRVYGAQFHPEKSGAAGLRLLANFVEVGDGPATGP